MESQPGSKKSDWRKISTGLLYNLKYILMNGIMTDLTIRLINGEDIKEYKVHKFVFQLASEVFDRMLNLPFKEGLSDIIEMKDVKPDTFQLFLNHLYGQPLTITNSEQAFGLLQLADYYLIHSLKDDIINFCQTTDTPECACVGLELAEKYEAPMLKKAKLQYISKNTKKVVESKNFLKLSLEAMVRILSQDKMSIREIDLFEAVRKWIKHNLAAKGESVKKILIPKLRYSSMSLREFIDGPVASNLVEGNDLVSLMPYLFTRNRSVRLPAGFSEAKRICINQLTTESLPLSKKSCDSSKIIFKVNKRIMLTHFFIYPALITNEAEYEENIKIKCDNNIIACFEGMVNVFDKIEIKLDKKLQLKRDQSYKFEIETSSTERNVVEFRRSIEGENISFKFDPERVISYSLTYVYYFAPLHSFLFEC